MLCLLRTIRHLGLWIAIVVLSTGCFQYLAVAETSAPPMRGASVRAHLRVPAEYPAGNIIIPRVATVVGEMVEQTEDEVFVSLSWVRALGGLEHRAAGETVSIPLDNLEALEVKRVAPVKTGILVGGLALVVGLLPLAFSGGGGEPIPGNGDGTTQR